MQTNALQNGIFNETFVNKILRSVNWTLSVTRVRKNILHGMSVSNRGIFAYYTVVMMVHLIKIFQAMSSRQGYFEIKVENLQNGVKINSKFCDGVCFWLVLMVTYDIFCLICYAFYCRKVYRRIRILKNEKKRDYYKQQEGKIKPLVNYKYLKQNIEDKLESDYQHVIDKGNVLKNQFTDATMELIEKSYYEYQGLVGDSSILQKIGLDEETKKLQNMDNEQLCNFVDSLATNKISDQELKHMITIKQIDNVEILDEKIDEISEKKKNFEDLVEKNFNEFKKIREKIKEDGFQLKVLNGKQNSDDEKKSKFPEKNHFVMLGGSYHSSESEKSDGIEMKELKDNSLCYEDNYMTMNQFKKIRGDGGDREPQTQITDNAENKDTFAQIKSATNNIVMSSKNFVENLQARPLSIVTNSVYDQDNIWANYIIDWVDKILVLSYIFIFIMGIFKLFYLEANCCEECSLAVTSVYLFLIQGAVDFLKPVISMSLICMCLPCVISLMANRTFLKLLFGDELEENYDVDDMRLEYRNYEGEDIKDGTRKCRICLDDFELGEALCVLPCNKDHFFHQKCGISVLKKQFLCPICQTNLYEEG